MRQQCNDCGAGRIIDGEARDHGLRTIALTGFEGGDARDIAEVAIHVGGTDVALVLYRVLLEAGLEAN